MIGTPYNDTQFKDVLNHVALVVKYLVFRCFQDNSAVTFDRFPPLSNKIETLTEANRSKKQTAERVW